MSNNKDLLTYLDFFLLNSVTFSYLLYISPTDVIFPSISRFRQVVILYSADNNTYLELVFKS